jgi:p-aminobenzoyl-glutamate transporter AbgT
VNSKGFRNNEVEKRQKGTSTVLTVLLLILAVAPNSARACAACYGQSDSPLASGVTWGILTLLAVVAAVLGSIVTFFVYINKKSASVTASHEPVAVYQSPVTDYQSPSPVTNH